jgi:ABC-type multidrug transport system fused ATPase/permease subunit
MLRISGTFRRSPTPTLPNSYIGIAGFACGYALVTFFTMAAERQAKRIREAYFLALLRQEIGWFDTNSAGTLTTRILRYFFDFKSRGDINGSDTQLIQDGIGDKLGLMIMYLTMFFAGFVLAFSALDLFVNDF